MDLTITLPPEIAGELDSIAEIYGKTRIDVIAAMLELRRSGSSIPSALELHDILEGR